MDVAVDWALSMLSMEMGCCVIPGELWRHCCSGLMGIEGFLKKGQLTVKASALLCCRARSLLPLLPALPRAWRDEETGSHPWQTAGKAKVRTDGWPKVLARGLDRPGGQCFPQFHQKLCAWGTAHPRPLLLWVHLLSTLLAPALQKGTKRRGESNPKREWVWEIAVKQMSGNHYENTLNLPRAAESFTANSTWLPVSHCCINDDNGLCYFFSTRSPPLCGGGPSLATTKLLLYVRSCWQRGLGLNRRGRGGKVPPQANNHQWLAPAAAFCAHYIATLGAFNRQHLPINKRWALIGSEGSEASSASRKKAISLFPCGSTDPSPLTQSLVQKSKRQVPSTMVHHWSLQAAHSYSPLVTQGPPQLCAKGPCSWT